MPQRYYSLNELDRKIEPYIDFDGGIFFEAGANDGVRQSNTCYFERSRGWRGVLVEPIVDRFRRCRVERPASECVWAALTPPDWPDPFVELTFCDLMTVTNSDLSPVDRQAHIQAGQQFLAQGDVSHKFYAPARTITDVLVTSGVTKVDFMSIDLEGFEAPALRGLDFSQVEVGLICVEAWDLDSIMETLGVGYKVVERLSHHDYLLARS